MSVVEVKEMFTRSADESQDDVRGERSYYVLTDSQLDGPEVAKNAPNIPSLGEAHPGDPGKYVSDKRARELSGHPLAFIVDVFYSAKADPALVPSDNPLLQPVRITGNYTTVQEEYTFDQDNLPVLNTAKDVFDPGPTRDKEIETITLVRNVAHPLVRAVELDFLTNKVNSNVKLGILPVGRLKISPRGYEKLFYKGTPYWQIVYELKVAPVDWKDHVANLGYQHIDPDDQTKKIRARNDDKTETASPVKLDAQGLKDDTPGSVIERIFRPYPSILFPAWIPDD